MINIDDAKLIEYVVELEPDSPLLTPLEPTTVNLTAALEDNVVPVRPHIHKAAKMEFRLRKIPFEAYIALENVTQRNPMTNMPVSTPGTDEFERNVILLTQGVAEPKLDRALAVKILKKMNWGPDNISLIDAIKELNPSVEERRNNFIVQLQATRFMSLFANVLDEVGFIDDLARDKRIKSDVVIALKTGIAAFIKLLSAEMSSEVWGIPMTREKLTHLNDELHFNEDLSSIEGEDGFSLDPESAPIEPEPNEAETESGAAEEAQPTE